MSTGPDHFSQAERLLDLAHHWTYGDGADPVTGGALATEGLGYAVLAVAARLGAGAERAAQLALMDRDEADGEFDEDHHDGWRILSEHRFEYAAADGTVWALEHHDDTEIGPDDDRAGWFLYGSGEFAKGVWVSRREHIALKAARFLIDHRAPDVPVPAPEPWLPVDRGRYTRDVAGVRWSLFFEPAIATWVLHHTDPPGEDVEEFHGVALMDAVRLADEYIAAAEAEQ